MATKIAKYNDVTNWLNLKGSPSLVVSVRGCSTRK